MTHIEKLNALRALMQEQNIDAYIIPSSDPHISEYLPKHYKCIAWTSGFTGSAGTLVITQKFAGLWTDSRYFVQANEQLNNTGFELVKLNVQYAPEYIDWLIEEFNQSSTIAFDGNLASLQVAQTIKNQLEKRGHYVNGHVDLLTPIWENRPSLPTNPAYTLSVETTGLSTLEKIKNIKNQMKYLQSDAHLVSSLDDLAWIFNIRGTDVSCNPVLLGFAYFDERHTQLYIADGKLNDKDKIELESYGIEIKEYSSIYDTLSTLQAKTSILIDPKKTCFAIYDSIPKHVNIVEHMNPSSTMKTLKNEIEIEHTRNAMINDGIALTKFFKWIEENVETKELTELSIAAHLRNLRAEQPGFKDVSFTTISGYKAHGALPHYSATEESNSTLLPEGLLLVDSGGQYLTGTTDITRVVSLGKLTQEEKDDYTYVLKGMIDGCMAIFPKGTRGYQIDAITRRPMWQTLRNYGHGTGHGVGFFLNVHEGPQVFNPTNVDIAIQSGMITSIEPGLYKEGHYGIRIENLVLAKEYKSSLYGDFMKFETLTICYIATDLIETSLLEKAQIDWLNDYNEWVYSKLSNHLSSQEKIWLRSKTLPIT